MAKSKQGQGTTPSPQQRTGCGDSSLCMLLELEKLHVVEDAGGSITELERTRKQKDILDALEKISWW